MAVDRPHRSTVAIPLAGRSLHGGRSVTPLNRPTSTPLRVHANAPADQSSAEVAISGG
jgi:hypothetical protein